ncbi:MAG: oxidoreductase domain protein [Myxococcaceae bacterium]|nr:oxidoreductase domain protein [Myxococcaceae bacterium]
MSPSRSPRRPRLGFLGVGWIGLQRMRAVVESGVAEVIAVADTSDSLRKAALEGLDGAVACHSLEELLRLELDGISIATPSALHAQQALACLEREVSVFCQKPLARNLAETRRVVEQARASDRLLGVDFSYRHTAALRAVKALLGSGELGEVYSARLVFHNAYGPDKPWYYERASSGGGCVMDLGIHLVDSILWLLEGAEVERVDSALYAQGRRLATQAREVEDFATARLELQGGATVELACSWKLPVGADAEIGIELFGPRGGVRFRNVSGSFYDFIAERMNGTATLPLASYPDAWGGRAIVAWAQQLEHSRAFDAAAAESFLRTAAVLDRIYTGDATTRTPR